MIAESLPVRLEEAKKIDDPLKRRLFVLAVITAALAPHHIRPILIGGGAVEYYTFGGYTTRDMDLAVADHQLLAQVMAELGFARQGRYWLREDLDALVEAPASTLVGEEAPLTQVEAGGLVCYILGVEDLIIDRLNGYVHWHWQDDRRWVERMIVLHGKNIDWAYLRRRAAEEQTAQALAEIEKGVARWTARSTMTNIGGRTRAATCAAWRLWRSGTRAAPPVSGRATPKRNGSCSGWISPGATACWPPANWSNSVRATGGGICEAIHLWK